MKVGASSVEGRGVSAEGAACVCRASRVSRTTMQKRVVVGSSGMCVSRGARKPAVVGPSGMCVARVARKPAVAMSPGMLGRIGHLPRGPRLIPNERPPRWRALWICRAFRG